MSSCCGNNRNSINNNSPKELPSIYPRCKSIYDVAYGVSPLSTFKVPDWYKRPSVVSEGYYDVEANNCPNCNRARNPVYDRAYIWNNSEISVMDPDNPASFSLYRNWM